MKEGIPKISVLVVCYNQEKLIRRAIESLLVQREYIYEICVSDDCSTDKTWDVLNDYSLKNPGLFVLNRNEPNIGIFENIEKTWAMPTGDIVYRLAGDDEVGEGWFKSIVEFVKQNQIDYHSNFFAIYGDYEARYPNGDSFTSRQSIVMKHSDRVRLYERGLLCNRSTCYSINVLKQFKKVSKGRSYEPENAIDVQLHLFTKDAYYIPKVGNIYYCSIGVSKAMPHERIMEHEQTMVYAFNFLKNNSYVINEKDRALPDYNIAYKRFRNDHSLGNLLRLFVAYVRILDFNCLINKNKLRGLAFGVVRRLPHKKPINW